MREVEQGEWSAYHTDKAFINFQKADKYCAEMNYKKFLEVYRQEKDNIEKVFYYFMPEYGDYDIINERIYDLKQANIDFDNLTFQEFLRMQDILDSLDMKEDIYFKTPIAFYIIQDINNFN